MPQICKHPTCKIPVFSKGYCKIHQYIVKGRAILKPVSAKRAQQNTVYHQKASAFKKLFPFCSVKVQGCTGSTTEIHHKRGRIGDLLTDEKHWLPVCRNCHNVIELNPEWAKENGYSESRLKRG